MILAMNLLPILIIHTALLLTILHLATIARAQRRELATIRRRCAIAGSADALGRLGKEGGARLPPAVIERIGLRTGDFVYFIDDKTSTRMVTGEQLDGLLPGDQPEEAPAEVAPAA